MSAYLTDRVSAQLVFEAVPERARPRQPLLVLPILFRRVPAHCVGVGAQVLLSGGAYAPESATDSAVD